MVKTSENDFQTLQHTCIGTFNNPLGPFRNLSTHIFRHQLPVRRGHTCTMETFLLVIEFQEACHSPLMPLFKDSQMLDIDFALKQVVPVSYYVYVHSIFYGSMHVCTCIHSFYFLFVHCISSTVLNNNIILHTFFFSIVSMRKNY